MGTLDVEERAKAQNLITQMIEEALDAFHRRLVVLSGEDLIDVLTFLILKHRALRILRDGEAGDIVYVDYYEDSGEVFKSLLERLETSGFSKESIKHFSYEESNKLLGTTNDILIMDMGRGARPNDIGRLIETVRGGGLIILYNLNLKADRPWETTLHKSLVHPPYQLGDLKTRFERFFVRKLLEAQGVWILEGWRILKGELLHPPKAAKRQLEIASEEIKVPKRLYRLALTEEQAKALQMVEELMRRREKDVLLVTSNRGRGKSALLGLSAAMLLHFGAGRIIITAPTSEESQIIFGMIEKGLNALNERFFREQRDELPRIRCKRGTVEFMLPQKALREEADILMVDEAAGIPVPLLFAFTERFPKIIFASTIHGYEGAGRGFSLRFLKALQESKGINLFKIELREPIRYAPNDPIEGWLYSALLLDAEPADIDAIKLSETRAEEYKYEKVDLDRWFEMEGKLREFVGIYVLAHYRNRPDDLLILGDSPHHSARIITAKSGEIVAALHLAEEGRMDEETINLVLAGNPPSGNLIPSCIVKYYPPYKGFAHLRGLRIVRIAVHPELTDRGIGSLALKNLSEEAEREGFDWIGASFGADRLLLNFWLKNGFIPVHLSPMRNIVSGEYSVIVVKPLSVNAKEVIKNLYMEFKVRLLNSLPDTYFNLEPEVAAQLLSINKWSHLEKPNLTPSQKDRLISYIQESLAYEGACDAVREILLAHFISSGELRTKLEQKIEVALIARCLQCRSWGRTAYIVGMRPAELKNSMRKYIKSIIEHYENVYQW
ncbi:MAG: GNAT family N-acetyltransferase [Candidatus Bathyarchaeia archaeon]|nr:tRNA(Met) cytidine acetyltransferase [Candidatus Bathyarchaeota archaeon]